MRSLASIQLDLRTCDPVNAPGYYLATFAANVLGNCDTLESLKTICLSAMRLADSYGVRSIVRLTSPEIQAITSQTSARFAMRGVAEHLLCLISQHLYAQTSDNDVELPTALHVEITKTFQDFFWCLSKAVIEVNKNETILTLMNS